MAMGIAFNSVTALLDRCADSVKGAQWVRNDKGELCGATLLGLRGSKKFVVTNPVGEYDEHEARGVDLWIEGIRYSTKALKEKNDRLKAIARAREQGVKAFWVGLGQEDCPYETPSMRIAWISGYQAADLKGETVE